MANVLDRRSPTTQGADGFPRRAFSIADVERMIDGGVLSPGERFELVRGEIVPMSPQTLAPVFFKMRLARWLMQHGPAELDVATEVTVALPSGQLFEPELALLDRLRPEARFAEVASLRLAVEIARTSLAFELGVKAPEYAAAGLPELWVLDLAGARTVRLRGPAATGFSETVEVPFDAPLASLAAPGAVVVINDIAAS